MTRRRVYAVLGIAAPLLLLSALLPALRGLGGLASLVGGDADAVPAYTVTRGDFVRRVHAEGYLEATEATLLGPPPQVRRGVRIAWLAPDGSHVEADEVVIRFDPTEAQEKLRDGLSQRETADSRITQKKVTEQSAMRNLGRDAEVADIEYDHARQFQNKDPEVFSRVEIIESEIDGGLATHRKRHAEGIREIRSELSTVELDLLAIERRKAELEISEAEEQLDRLEVRAPHAGIFVLREVWGDLPQVGSQIWGGQPVAEIPRLEKMQAKVYVLEADAGGLDVDVPAEVRLDAHPGRVYDARASQVDALAQPRNRRVPVQYFGVTLALARTEIEVMKPGQRVQAVLTLDELEDVITVPLQALFEEDERSVVHVRRSGGYETVEVRLGPSAMGRVVVEEGLAAGDVIALRDPDRPLGAAPGGNGGGGNGGGAPTLGGAS